MMLLPIRDEAALSLSQQGYEQPKLKPRQEAHVAELYRAGGHTTAELAELFGVARSTIYRAVGTAHAVLVSESLWCRSRFAQRDASCPGKAFRRLSGDLGDEVEVLVEVYDGEPGQFCRSGDDEVGD